VDTLRERFCEDNLAETIDEVLNPSNWPDPVGTSSVEAPLQAPSHKEQFESLMDTSGGTAAAVTVPDENTSVTSQHLVTPV